MDKRFVEGVHGETDKMKRMIAGVKKGADCIRISEVSAALKR